jgi:hypothetical protein
MINTFILKIPSFYFDIVIRRKQFLYQFYSALVPRSDLRGADQNGLLSVSTEQKQNSHILLTRLRS